jgi:hypothetical protein
MAGLLISVMAQAQPTEAKKDTATRLVITIGQLSGMAESCDIQTVADDYLMFQLQRLQVPFDAELKDTYDFSKKKWNDVKQKNPYSDCQNVRGKFSELNALWQNSMRENR